MRNQTIFFAIFVLFIRVEAGEITLRTCISRGASDYFSYLESLKLPNPAKNLLTRVAADLNVKLVFENSELNRCLKNAKDSEVEAVYPVIFNKEVESLFVTPPEAAMLSTVKWNVYALAPAGSASKFKTLKDIKEPIGLLFDYKITETLLAEGVVLDQTAKTPEDLVRQLLTGRVGAIFMVHYDFAKARTSFKAADMDKIKLNFTYREDANYFLLTKSFSKKYPGLSEKFYSRIITEKNKALFRQEMDTLDKKLQ